MHVDDGQLNALLDGELDAVEKGRVQAHLAECAECARRLEEARAFLTEAGELLGVLTPSLDVKPLPPRTVIEESGLVAPLSRGPAASGSTAKKEGTSEPAVAKTAKEVAVSIDGRTALTPAIRPVQPREVPKQPARWRIPELEKLAWAASLVLCVAVGYLGREVLQLRRERAVPAAPQALAQAQPEAGSAADNASSKAPPPRRDATRGAAPSVRQVAGGGVGGPGHQPAAPASAGRGRAPAGEPAAKPPGTRESKAAPAFAQHPPEQIAAQPAPAPVNAPVAERSGAAASRAPSNAAGAASDVAVRSTEAPRAAPAGAAPVAAAAASRLEARLDEIASSTATPAPLSAFRRVTLEEAVARLSGNPIRQMSDLQPIRVEAGPGRLVTGADPARDVIRVTYADQHRTQFVLDQQLREAEGSFAGMMEGDTLVTTTASGNMRVRWIDGKFWLSLSGNAGADSLRRLIAKIR